MADTDKTPIDQALDLFVFAPLGLVSAARELLPELIAKGRQQWGSQSAMAKMMGEYAVREAEKRARTTVGELAQTLEGLGVIGGATPPPRATRPAAPAGPTTEAPASNGKAPAPPPSSAGLAIPGYDTLSAPQVVQRLGGLAADELEAVRAYEAATRGRRTILSKISQLQNAAS